jgi:hypothetical protein
MMMRISVLDDLDGTEGAGPVQFGLDGEIFEIDLSKDNHAKLREIASFYIGHGRKVTPAARVRHTSVYAHFGSTSRPGALRVSSGPRGAFP